MSFTMSTSKDECAPLCNKEHEAFRKGCEISLLESFLGDADGNILEKWKRDLFLPVLEISLSKIGRREYKKHSVTIPDTVTFSTLPEDGMSIGQLVSTFNHIADFSTNSASSGFIGFPDSGNAAPALGASMLQPFLNQNLINQTLTSPQATFIEMETVHWLRSVIGYISPDTPYSCASDIGGCSTVGGTLSNTIGIYFFTICTLGCKLKPNI